MWIYEARMSSKRTREQKTEEEQKRRHPGERDRAVSRATVRRAVLAP